MKFFKCGKCDKILEDKYAINHPKSEITWYNATEHEEIRKKKVDDLQENSNEEDKEKKDESRKAKEHEKLIQAYRAELDDMDKDEMDELISQLKAQIEELRKKLNPETDEDKQSKQASLEYLAIGSPHHNKISGDYLMTGTTATNKSNYSALVFSQNYRDKKIGDKLLIRLGSVD